MCLYVCVPVCACVCVYVYVSISFKALKTCLDLEHFLFELLICFDSSGKY